MSHDHTPEHPRPLRGLLPYLLSRPSTFAGVVVSGIVLSLTSIAAAGAGAWLIGGAVSGVSADQLYVRGWLLAGLTLAAVVAVWWQSHVGHDWAFRLLGQLRVAIYDGLERATPGRLLGKRTGDLASSAVADVNTTELFFAHVAGDYVGAILVSVAAVGLIGALAPPAAVVTAVVMALVAVVPFLLARRAGAQGRAMRAELGMLNAEALDGVQGLRELAVFGQGTAYVRRLVERTDRFQRQRLRYASRSGAEQALTDLLLSVGALAVLVATAQAVAAGRLAPALTPVVVVLAIAAIGPIAAVSATARTLGEVRAAAGRVLAIVRYPAQVHDLATKAPNDLGPEMRPDVRFDRVSFGYRPDEPVLRELSFSIEPGETVALVGASGAGKTTCANLLQRFWDTDAGQVRIGGHDVRDLPVRDLRRLVGLVPQDAYLFNTTVRDNIRLGRPGAGDAEVEAAARQALAHEFISELPDGYDTVCAERGAAFSGGQRQRIAIARALLAGTPILILDEAVSQLDTASERAVGRAMAAAQQARTTLVIAHRRSTIRAADRVVLLSGGSAVDTGTHDELLERSVAYRDLLAGQPLSRNRKPSG
jgi:ATP-binding cassette, subfamily C, bacterial CydC